MLPLICCRYEFDSGALLHTGSLKRSYYAFGVFCLPFIVLCGIFVHVKGLQSEKAQVQAKGSYFLPPAHQKLYTLHSVIRHTVATAIAALF